MSVYRFFKPPLITKPPEFPPPDPVAHPEWYGEIYVRYSSSSVPVPTNHPQVFHAICHFRVLLNEIAASTFGGRNKGMSLNLTLHYYRRLKAWFDDLPERLNPKHIVLPAHFKTQ